MEYETVITIRRTAQLVMLPGETEEECLARNAAAAKAEFSEYATEDGASVRTKAYRLNT